MGGIRRRASVGSSLCATRDGFAMLGNRFSAVLGNDGLLSLKIQPS
jgi:hypothetical protein